MKKKSIALSIAAVLILVIGAWLLARPKALGNINASFDEQATSCSEVSFTAREGERIKLSFRSDRNAGALEFALYDSNDNKVYALDHARALETFYTFRLADTYTLRAEYTDFIGSFEIAVYPTT